MSTRLGVHRSIDPPGALPQAARVLDPSLPIRPDEILIAVERLNVDAASFVEFERLAAAAGVPVREVILDTVRERGKLENPVTGSGGMLIGAVGISGDNSDHDEAAAIAGIEAAGFAADPG